jgi:membrane protease YdiL (CAAX protease family)
MNAPSPRQVVRLSLVFYLPMIACAFFVRAPGTLRVEAPLALLPGLAAALLAGGAVVGLSRLAARHTGWGRAMAQAFQELLGDLGSAEILALSLLSALGEEILFRGVLQPRVGLLLASVLFAALHFPYRRALLPWTGFALVLGLVLGAGTAAFGSLWPAILLHFVINYFNLHDLAARPPLPGS